MLESRMNVAYLLFAFLAFSRSSLCILC